MVAAENEKRPLLQCLAGKHEDFQDGATRAIRALEVGKYVPQVPRLGLYGTQSIAFRCDGIGDQIVDVLRREADQTGLMDGLDAFTRKAFEMVTSPAAQKAFDIQQEEARLRDRYGRTNIGQNFLLARRLVESGVTFVTVNAGGWDTHANNFEALKKQKLPEFDQAWSALVDDMHSRGMYKNTLVLVWGEVGRTPRINTNAGRDHWPGAMSVVLAGGNMKMGQTIGATDAKAEYPRERPISPEDVLSTMYQFLGIDQNIEYMNEAQRPIKVLNSGTPIKELVG